jgi:uncharacterized repeat protein (TIGR02543 family)
LGCEACINPLARVITFNVYGGAFTHNRYSFAEVLPEQNVGILPRASVFYRENYRFMGWYADLSDETTRWNDMEEVTESITLYARWAPAPADFQLGVTGDNGRVTSADATQIARYLLDNGWEICRLAADINGDGLITIEDVTLLSRWLVGHNVRHQIAL